MGLNGNFKETPFADLLQFYSMSKQTAAVHVRLGAGEGLDGIFYFGDGDLLAASLGGAEGREAVRRALRLHEGTFTVDAKVRPPEVATREHLRSIVMEEFVRLDEENRAGARATGAARATHTGAVATASTAWWTAPAQPISAAPPSEALTPATPKPLAAQPAPAPRPPAGAPPPGGAPPRRAPAPPAGPPPRRGIAGTLAGVVIAAVVVLGGVTWFVLHRAPVQGAPEVVAAVPSTGPRGVADDGIVLGMVASFTGSNKERGRAMRLGWETAIASANEAGGVQGRRLRLVAFDDAYDPSRTLAAMKEAIEKQGAFAIVGNVGTATSAVAIPYAAEKDAVFFGALSGADVLRKSPPDRNVFNFRASLSREGEAAVKYLVEVRRLDPKRVAILAQEDDFGASGRRGGVRQLGTYGVAEADVLQLGYPRNTADVRDALAKLKERAREVDAVVMIATYKPAATFIRKSKDAGLKLFYTTVSADSNGLSEELVESGAQYTENVLLTQVVPVPTSHATTLVRYRQALEKFAPGEKPGSTSLEAWIGAQIFLEAVNRAGRELETAKLVAALESIKDWDLGIGGAITFGSGDHQGSDMVFGWVLQPDGSYRQVELE